MELEQSLNIQYWVYLFLAGFFFSTGILLILIYFFNKAKISFLYYSLTIFIASALQILYYFRGVNFFLDSENFSVFNWPLYERFHVLLNLLVHAGFVLFLFASVQSGKWIVRIFLVSTALVILLLFASGNDFANNSVYNFSRNALQWLYYTSCTWLLIRGYLKNIPFFNWVIGGVFLYLFTEIFITADYFALWNDYTLTRSVLWLAGLTVPFTLYAVFLSKDLALTSKLLNQEVQDKKLKEIEAKRIREVNTLKSRFFANISHEFRTPLTLILAPIENLMKKTSSSEDKLELTLVQRNAARLLNLVNQLLDLSKLESGSVEAHIKRYNLNNFVSATASQFQSMAVSKGIRFELQATENIMCAFDPDKLDKVIFNLLSNAFKFTPEGGLIRVILKKGFDDERFTGGFAELMISDTGPGIGPEHLDRIFDRFYQADSSATREFEGSGIGLALTKELVELHGGFVSVQSELDQGTTFTVRLPLGDSFPAGNEDAEVSAPVKHPAWASVPGVGTHEPGEVTESALPHVLVVEDNEDLRIFLRENLKQHYHVLLAKDGKEGLALAQQEIPDLVISDLMMPGMDGIQLIARLKRDEKTSHIPVILLTAKADLQNKIEGLETGADDYIAKPFDMTELRVRARNLIENRKKLQQKFSSHLTIKPSEIVVESVEDRFIKKVVETIEKHLDDPTFGVEVLAEEVAMSSVQLYRKLKALTNHKPVDLIRNIRLERAASLLKQHAGSVAEIAYQAGFNNLSYFAKCFREKYGVTPSEFVKT